MKPQKTIQNTRKPLREALKQRRRALPRSEQDSAARLVAEQALSGAHFPLGDHISLYMDTDGEIGTRYLLEGLLAQGRTCYLPVLVKATITLEFRRYDPAKALVTNFYGLLEPDAAAEEIAPEALDTVFMPLVGFDTDCNRLGMGGGYYDRTFAFLNTAGASGPTLIGLAHECQRVEKLEAADWDVPLGGIITPRRFYRGG